MYITIKNVVDAFFVYSEIFCRYEALWDGPVAMVAYSFGGLVLKSLVVDSVPHAGSAEDLSKYFKWQCQQINKDTIPSSLLKNMESFNPQMEQLSIDFNKSICDNINIYAFVEGLPIDKELVRFLSIHIDYLTRFHS
jgi:hypothetical protein